jgi:hypothetical protein
VRIQILINEDTDAVEEGQRKQKAADQRVVVTRNDIESKKKLYSEAVKKAAEMERRLVKRLSFKLTWGYPGGKPALVTPLTHPASDAAACTCRCWQNLAKAHVCIH